MLQRAAELMREVARQHGLAVFDQAQAVEMLVRRGGREGHTARTPAEGAAVAARGGEEGRPAKPMQMLWSVAIRPGDGVHPTPAACAWLWLKLVHFVNGQVERGSASWVGAEASLLCARGR
jgi:hypothetical protein